MLFEMHAGIRFNRVVDVEKDYISPGGFIMVMEGNPIHFDFSQYSINVDRENGCLVHVVFKYPDEEEFPEVEQVTEYMLRDVSVITEFFVYTGEPKETDLQAVSLEYVCFTLPIEEIEVKQEVVEAAVCAGCFRYNRS